MGNKIDMAREAWATIQNACGAADAEYGGSTDAELEIVGNALKEAADISQRTCGNCRFRSCDPARRVNLGDGPEHDFPTSYYHCERVEYDDHPLGISHAPGLGAVVNGGGGADSGLFVELDFGCNKWEPKT